MTDHELILMHCCDDLHMRPAHGHRPTPTCSCGWRGKEHLATLWAKAEWEEHVNYGDASTQPMPSGTPESWDPGDAHCTACGGSGLVGDQQRRFTTAAENLAQRFHEAYERLAPSYGYETREASAKPWAEVPVNNKFLMIAVCAEILAGPTTNIRATETKDE